MIDLVSVNHGQIVHPLPNPVPDPAGGIPARSIF